MKVIIYRNEWDSYEEKDLSLLEVLLTVGNALQNGALKVEDEP